MDSMKNILDRLNEKQREAVIETASHVLVLAGAGSGKTRVLIHRMAWLVFANQVSPYAILAVTFTNKAALSMRTRIEKFFDQSMQGMWIGTFHGLCHKILRAHHQAAKLEEHFQILDTDDQQRLIKRLLKELNIDEVYWPAKKVQWFINAKKEAGLRAKSIESQTDRYTETMVKIYDAYEQACQRLQLVDFAELLLRVYELWQENSAILAHYQDRFKHILVDEFQDTNTLQYRWLCLLAGKKNHFMIVGDDDQSIYGWRGAEVENIERFLKDFAPVKTIRLEQNYRSTGKILEAANAVIAKNAERLGKVLWTEQAEGESIRLYEAFNEIDEARFVVSQVQHWLQQGYRHEEIAILYRSNAQSRVLEEAFMQANMAYRVYGGFRFFERAEIKDALAYLRLVFSVHDDTAFERVINMPTRGIGEKALSQLREQAKTQKTSLWQAAEQLVKDVLVPSRIRQALSNFLQLMTDLTANCHDLVLYEQIEMAIQLSGLKSHYAKEKGEKAQTRLENLAELVTAARQFLNEADYQDNPLAAFLAHAVLESGEEKAKETSDAVQLMTMHAAKGLEFPVVFITGVEEGLFPHPLSCQERHLLEEERRLFYVAITRAQQQLCLTFAEVRRLHGTEQYHRASRFIEEIPDELIEPIKFKKVISRSSLNKATFNFDEEATTFRLGQRVVHPVFGEGTVLHYEGTGSHTRVQVKFNQHGTKWLVESYAKLESL